MQSTAVRGPLVRPFAFLLNFELWIVALLTAAAMVQPALLLPAVLAALVFWPLRKAAAGSWTRRTPADLPALVILLAVSVSFLVTAVPETTTPQILRLLNGLALFYAVVNWAVSKERLRLLYVGLILAGIALAGVSFLTVEWSVTKFPFIPGSLFDRFPTLVSDTVHPNVLGGALLLSAPLAGAAALWGGFRTRWVNIIALAALGWMAAVMVLTQSRGALLGLAGAILILIALRWRWGRLGFVLAGIGSVWVLSLFGVENAADLLFGGRILGGFRGRTEIWGRGIFMLQDFPFTGVGFGLFPLVVDRIYPFFSAAEGSVHHAHNLFLQIGIDLGIPGLIAWLAGFLSVAWAGWRFYRSGAGDPGKLAQGAGAGILAVQAALLVHGLFDAVIWGQVRTAPLPWLVWGFALAFLNLGEESEASAG